MKKRLQKFTTSMRWPEKYRRRTCSMDWRHWRNRQTSWLPAFYYWQPADSRLSLMPVTHKPQFTRFASFT